MSDHAKVTVVFGLQNLPAWVDKQSLSQNGSGAEYASYLLIEDGDYRACYSDAMEPEDCTFGRDLSWIKKELERLADAIRDARLKEAEWWDARRKIFSTVPENVYKEHIEQLKRGET